MRRPLVVANWKMNGCTASNQELMQSFLSLWQGVHQAEVAVCPPAIYLQQVADLLAQSNVALGAQDVSAVDEGAYTGEVSAAMLADIGCRYVIVGHSERREYHAEADELVAKKFLAAQRHRLTPILCVGETLAQRESDETLIVVSEQLKAVVDLVGRSAVSTAVIAYEPVWAIGTGLTATPQQAQEVHAYIREQLGEAGAGMRILYGGSVKPSSAEELFAQQDIDGALVGGASLVSDDFYRICQAAE